jgi:hypothetical protein
MVRRESRIMMWLPASPSKIPNSCCRDTPSNPPRHKKERDLKAEFPMLQVKVYDAGEKKLLELPPTE